MLPSLYAARDHITDSDLVLKMELVRHILPTLIITIRSFHSFHSLQLADCIVNVVTLYDYHANGSLHPT